MIMQSLQSPESGIVVEVLVSAGEFVKKGDVLGVMDTAGKERLLETQFGGIIYRVLAREGESVDMGEELFTIV